MLKTAYMISFLFLILTNVQCNDLEKLNEKNLIQNKISSFALESEKHLSKISEYFTKNGVTLNCFGLSVDIFAKAVEKMFTRETEAKDVRFYFYSRNNPEIFTVHAGEDFNLEETLFQTNRKTVLLVHGFMSSGQEKWLSDMKDAFLKSDDYNVIIVDWQKGSNTWSYISASVNTKIVGTEIAKLLSVIHVKALEKSPGLEHSGLLHLVGHSLGAHIMGNVAFLIRSSDLNKWWSLERITGLDPAQPCFTTTDLSLKLDKDDAPFVDIIHTNARNLMLLGLGLPDQLGHMDFYPNGGQIQLGCDKIDTSLWNFLMLPIDLIKKTICSHGRSHELFTDSINVKVSGKCTYLAHNWDRKYDNISGLLKAECDKKICPEMGIKAINYYPNEDETFFVPTGDSEHYCEISESSRNAIKKQLLNDKSSSNNIILTVADKLLG